MAKKAEVDKGNNNVYYWSEVGKCLTTLIGIVFILWLSCFIYGVISDIKDTHKKVDYLYQSKSCYWSGEGIYRCNAPEGYGNVLRQ